VPFERQRPSHYAQALRRALRSSDPGRKVDLLLAGALIEARSAERFALLAPRLSPPLARLYADLGTSEARHHEMYIGFARAREPLHWQRRLAELAACEAEAAVLPGSELRFHSGPLLRA
jgi:tRNA 2-(methylsulfanyl)-N6-isopentenyladenosine37 hydroxylase